MKYSRAAPGALSASLCSAMITIMALAPASLWAAAGGTGIEGTAHDFTAGVHGNANTEAVGLCSFCHTPHKAITTKLLWNHELSTASFSWDATETTAGTTFPTIQGDTYTGPTAKCLSCHDGTVAIGDVAWWMEGKPTSPLQTEKVDAAFQIAGAAGAMKGNHPVAMPYPFGNLANTYNGATTGAGAVLSEWQADPVASNVPGTSMIRLFSDVGGSGINITAGATAGVTGIECSSCHDPHNKASVDDLFLRGKIVGSAHADGYLCLQCHVK